MSLSLSLNNALSGLNINQQSLSVLSQNIANANTPGYTRKIATQQAIYLDGRGAGVSIVDVSRKVDEYLTRAIRLQSSVQGKAEAVSDYSDRTQLLLGNPGASNNASSYINTFFNSLQSLAQTPENSTLRVNAINSATTLTREINTLSQGLSDLRLQAEQDIGSTINSINANLVTLQGLNKTINNDSLLGKSVGELQDRRDSVLRDLSQYIDINTYTRSDGVVSISTGSGVSLLDDSVYQIQYTPASSVAAFQNDAALFPIQVYRLNDLGQRVGNPTELVSGGKSAQIASSITSGKLRALIDLRDRTLPDQLAQLDRMAANFRDEFNAVHNTGIGFPGAQNYTGKRSVNAGDFSQWVGKARLAVLGSDGRPVTSPYPDETSGIRPLTLDLGKLDTGQGPGYPTVQGIIDEINQRYGPPKNKAVVGALNDIRLVSDSTALPASPPQFNFDFDLENISGGNASFYVTNVQVLDSTDTALTPVTSGVPKVSLSATNTYQTTAANNSVVVNTATAHGLTNGQKVFLSTPPGGPYNGIPASQLGGFFTVKNVSSTSFEIEVTSNADTTSGLDVAAQTAFPPYKNIAAGDYDRTKDKGLINADLSGNVGSDYYTIKVDVGVVDANGNLVQSQVSYRINNAQSNLLNRRYGVENVVGEGKLVRPTSTEAIARALLVDANGNELPNVNGKYGSTQNGFLKIVAGNSTQVMAIDSLDSQELGRPGTNNATGRGFSHFFELNNFFNNTTAASGDTVTGAALNLSIEDRLVRNPNLISLGKLVQSPAPNDPTKPPLYTYERNVGDNTVAQKLASLSTAAITFATAGGLGQISTTFAGYAGAIIGTAATNSANAQSDSKNAKSLMDGYSDRSDAISGVNLDEELANTVIYQNAYTASTRVISVVSELFKTLMDTF